MGPTSIVSTEPARPREVRAGGSSRAGESVDRQLIGGRWLWWSAIGFVVLYLLAVRTAEGQRLDQAAMLVISAAARSSSWAEQTLLAVSASSMLLATAAVVVATGLSRGRRQAFVGAVAAGTVVAGAELLKLVLDRPTFLTATLGNSFPSGHVAAVAALAVALMIALPTSLRRPVAVLVAAPAVGLTGLATIVLLWHRPSDVVGSVLLAVTVGVLALQISDHSGHADGAPPRRPSGKG